MSDSAQSYDILILGIGHQSLIAANYLAKAKFKVCVLDAPSPLTGAKPYEPFHEGVMTGPCAHVPLPIRKRDVQDLNLSNHGFDMRAQSSALFSPQEKEGFFYGEADLTETENALAQFAPEDASTFIKLHNDCLDLASILHSLSDDMPAYTNKGWKDIWGVFETAKHLTGKQAELQPLFGKLMTMSLNDFLDEHFTHDGLKGLLALQGSMGSMINPRQKNTAYTLISYFMGLGSKPLFQDDWQPLRGSMHSYFKALTATAIENGVIFETAKTVESVSIQGGQITSITTDDGEFKAPIILGDINPLQLFTKLISEDLLPPEFKSKVAGFKGHNGFVRVKAALNKMPTFHTLVGQDHNKYLKGETLICPSLDYLNNAYTETKTEGGSQRPGVSLIFPSIQDPDLVQNGMIACSIMGQYFDPTLPDNQDNKIAVAKALVSSVNAFAPDFQDSIESFLPIMGEVLDLTISPLNPDISGGSTPLSRLFRRRFTHHSVIDDVPFDNLYLVGLGPESSSSPQLADAGFAIAQYIIRTQTPLAA